MKNYKKSFGDANKAINERIAEINSQINKKSNVASLFSCIFGTIGIGMVFYLTLGMDFLNFRWEWLIQFIYGDVIAIIFLTLLGVALTIAFSLLFYTVLASLMTISLRNQYDELSDILYKKAKEFALNVYFNDIIAALNSVFIVSSEFKEKLKNIIAKYEWAANEIDESTEDETIVFEPDGIALKYLKGEDQQLTINHEECKCTYYLKGWDYYENLPFRFYFDKVHSNGEIKKKIEFELPVNK